MKGLRFAIIGCGSIAKRHAQHIAARGVLKAVCDVVPEKADELARRYNARPYYSIEHLLEEKDIDLVSVCTPNGFHAEHSIKCMQAGFHVLCEKPMAITVPDCHAMIRVSQETGRLLFVVKQNRFNPPVVAVKQALDRGTFGRLYSIQINCFWNRDAAYYTGSPWKGRKELDGGILFTQFSHFIDLAYWMGGDITEAKLFAGNYAHQGHIDLEDTGVAILQFASGAIGGLHYTVNSYGRNMEGSLTIFGERGTVKIGGQYLNVLEYQAISGYKIDNLPVGEAANDYGSYQGSMSNHGKVYENVVNVLLRNQPMATTPHEGLKTVEIIKKIYSSAIRS